MSSYDRDKPPATPRPSESAATFAAEMAAQRALAAARRAVEALGVRR